MFARIKMFFMRIQSASLKRMWMYVCEIHKKSKAPKIFTVLDMLWCTMRYGIGYLEYHVFGFTYIHGKKRKTFMTMHHNMQLIREANCKELDYLFTDKIEFNKRFQEYIGRSWLDLRNAGFEDFQAFIKNKESVFVKQVDGFGGLGADLIKIDQYPDVRALYDSLVSHKQFVVEECIVQHSEMNKLCATSVNTIRIVTLLRNDQVNVIYSLIRMGNGKKHVDNISSGGLYCPVNEKGIIYKPGFCDKTGLLYEEHPATKTKLVGFQIPFYDEAIEMVKNAARVVPQIGYVGWDVAICESGPILIEGNTVPGYDMCQNYYHLDGDSTGIWPRFEKIIKNGNSSVINKSIDKIDAI